MTTPAPPRPLTKTQPALDCIPLDLRSTDRWHMWKFEDHGKPKRDKVPYQPLDPSRHASSTRAETWSSFADASATLLVRRAFDGIGFALGDGWAGVDLDHVRNAQTGFIEPWALELITDLDSYTEISPSGEGVKIFLLADLRKREGHRKAELPDNQGGLGAEAEMYWQGRFFTVTGQHLPGTPAEVNQRQAQLEKLHTELFPPVAPNPIRPPANPLTLSISDDALLQKARRSKQGAKFERLWAGDPGDYGGDDSRADIALCSMLAFWTAGNEARIDALFRQSGLMRPKWDEKHGAGTYGAITIRKALSEASDYYLPKQRLIRGGVA